MRRTNTRNEQPAPASQTRPKLATTRPEPVDEAPRKTRESEAIRASIMADEYTELRIEADRIKAKLDTLGAELIAAMIVSGKERFTNEHGLVSLLRATEEKQVPDEAAAVALLESKGIPQPPTLQEWLARHELAMPTKPKKGLPDRIEFRKNK